MRVFLTGGTGLLGSHVAERLRGRGHEVRALHRPGSAVGFLANLGCELVEGDLSDSVEDHARRLGGCEGLVHAAAHIYNGTSLEAVRSVNVSGTTRLLQAAVSAGVSQTVHISSAAVYGDPPAPLHEGLPLTAPLRRLDYYGMTKREGEQVARSFHGRDGMDVTILRPPVIFGERDRLFIPKLAAFLRRRLVFLLGSGETRLAAVYAGNVAQAVELALDGRGRGQVFNVTEDVTVTQRWLYDGLAREMGIRVFLVPLPAFLARLGARIGDAVGIRIPGARDLSLTRAVRVSTEDNPYPADRARMILGWDPPFSREEALARTGAWINQFLKNEDDSNDGR